MDMRAKVRNQSFVYTFMGYVMIVVLLVLLVGGLVALRFWTLDHNVSDESLAKWGNWVGFLILTSALFGYVIKRYRRSWRSAVFWATLAGFLVVHVTSFWIIVGYIDRWKMVWSLMIWPIEFAVIVTTLNWTTDRLGRRHRKNLGLHS